MKQYIDKSAVVAEIENRIKELQNLHKENEERLDPIQKTAILLCIDECKVILSSLDTLEVKEEPVSNDLEEFAKRESESFAEREYEIDYIDRNALAKGYYWGVKAGAQWQKEQDQSTIEIAEDHAYFAGSEKTRGKLIEKACEWLKDNWRKYVWFDGDNVIHFGLWENDFCKAMEE